MIYDVVVAGGGIVGLSIAWRVAQQGMSVCLIDRSEEPRGASWVAAGMLAPVTEAAFGEQRLLALNLEGARRWPAFASELAAGAGVDLGHSGAGTLYVAHDRDQAEALRRLYDYHLGLGLPVRWLRPAELREREPALHPAVRAGVLAEQDLSVDPRRVIAALQSVLKQEGVTRKVAEIEALAFQSAPRVASGVALADGQSVQGGQVVLAAGCWSGRIVGAPPGLARAVRPVKGQILRLRTRSPLISHIVRTEEVYLVPRPDGELVVGATVEERGFDSTPTAGGALELLRAATEAVPGIRELELEEVSAGLRPGSPDNGPLVGKCSVPGLLLAAGHYRNGILQAPVTAHAIARLLATGETPANIAGFEPARFGF
ncbi:MAG: glycine oxidase ThiO [Actinomycetota bacterium]